MGKTFIEAPDFEKQPVENNISQKKFDFPTRRGGGSSSSGSEKFSRVDKFVMMSLLFPEQTRESDGSS